MIQLSLEELRQLKEESITQKSYGGRRTLPYAFTEQGVAMLSAVLHSKRAVAVSVQIMRSFVQLRELLMSNESFAKRVRTLESKTDEHARLIVQIINELQKPPELDKRRIGF
jgi:hypothetical protein